MKMKTIISVLALGLSGTVYAVGDYFPPERMHCKSNEMGQVVCSDFNRQYLTEATHTANLPTGIENVFNFTSGTAFKTEDNQWAVFYTYQDTSGKNVRIKSVNTSIRPDLVNGSWTQYKDIFTCSAGYMSCPITNLPARS